MSSPVSNHPELATLKDYLANSAAENYAGLRLHLAQCPACRELVSGLSGVQLMTSMQNASVTLTEQQHQGIADYIDGLLDAAEAGQQQAVIHSDAAAMKAALHYASHKAAMDQALSRSDADSAAIMKSTNASSQSWSGIFSALKDMLSFQAPVWLTVPVTAALVAVLTIKLLDVTPTQPVGYTIASYQDNPVIQFRARENIPGIGFFARPAQSVEPYQAVKVSVSAGNRFTIQWPPVTGAMIYTLRLQMFNQGSKLVLGEVTTQNNSAVMTVNIDNIYHRYEWVLSGETRDNRAFMSSGGFVINNAAEGDLK